MLNRKGHISFQYYEVMILGIVGLIGLFAFWPSFLVIKILGESYYILGHILSFVWIVGFLSYTVKKWSN